MSDSKNNVKPDGTIETILPQFDGNTTVKVYDDPLTGKHNIGVQAGGQGHRSFASSCAIDGSKATN